MEKIKIKSRCEINILFKGLKENKIKRLIKLKENERENKQRK